jgi:hypothetical protein
MWPCYKWSCSIKMASCSTQQCLIWYQRSIVHGLSHCHKVLTSSQSHAMHDWLFRLNWAWDWLGRREEAPYWEGHNGGWPALHLLCHYVGMAWCQIPGNDLLLRKLEFWVTCGRGSSHAWYVQVLTSSGIYLHCSVASHIIRLLLFAVWMLN